jgi:pimeloyl-ACP methyl ester carboxylesterase
MIYIVFLLFTLLVFYIAFYQWQYFMVFSPIYFREGEFDDDFTMLSMKTDDGVELEGVVYEPNNPHATILFFAGRSHDSVAVVKKLAQLYTTSRIITFNYRSYGKSKGVASEKNIFEDGLKIAKLVYKNYGDFYILGFSIGSSVASYVASKHQSLAVFLVGAFDSIALLAKEKFVKRGFFPMIDLSKIFRYSFDNRVYVSKIEAKTYLFASKDDEITYIQNARNLKDYVKNLEYYKEYDNLSHKELLWHVEVVDKIREVIE